MSKKDKKKKKHERKPAKDPFPIVICKFYKQDGSYGTCTELVDRLCMFKGAAYAPYPRIACGRYRPEQDGDVL